MEVKVSLRLPSADEILNGRGLDPAGHAQQFHTANVLRRIVKYMPHLTGATIKLTAAQTDVRVPEIVTREPQAAYLFYGVSMAGTPRAPTGRPLRYTKTKNPLAGPRWDRALAAAEGAALAADLRRYLKRGGGR